ncbi:MAG: hypothetical protein HYX24_07185 [Candidatus Aenigmarchaeota archaeon]|nr:hypothetical protein [Candidatus Aenigmarchaeota archaeon]
MSSIFRRKPPSMGEQFHNEISCNLRQLWEVVEEIRDYWTGHDKYRTLYNLTDRKIWLAGAYCTSEQLKPLSDELAEIRYFESRIGGD